MLRSVLVAALIISAGLIGIGHADATMPATVDVINGKCVNGEVTRLAVGVELRTERPVVAVFRAWSQRDRVRVAWGQRELRPGSNRVTIVAPGSVAALTDESQAQLMINVGQKRAYDHFNTGNVCANREDILS